MANDPNDVSDVKLFTPDSVTQVGAGALPIRGEKRIVPSPVTAEEINLALGLRFITTGQDLPQLEDGQTLVDQKDFNIRAAKRGFTEYVLIRIPHRGQNEQGEADPTQAAYFRFLINPSTVSIQKQVIDAQAMTRAGWQFGVWGEDVTQITMSGKSGGQFFALGLTDNYQSFSVSYRNLQQLQTVFENNGYWFEGEAASAGPNSPDYTRRRIKMQQDVELTVGNFIWSGMFEGMSLRQDANNPFNVDFELTFIAWKERYRSQSPYWNPIPNNVEYGHSYEVFQTAVTNGTNAAAANSSDELAKILPIPNPPLPVLTSPDIPVPQPAAFAAEVQTVMYAPEGIAAYDFNPDHVTGTEIQLENYWNE